MRNKPDPVTTDYRGTKIEPGKIVAYNFSGYVRLGRIIALRRNDVINYSRNPEWPNWIRKFDLEVQCLDQDSVSHIKNPGSFVILENLPMSSNG